MGETPRLKHKGRYEVQRYTVGPCPNPKSTQPHFQSSLSADARAAPTKRRDRVGAEFTSAHIPSTRNLPGKKLDNPPIGWYT